MFLTNSYILGICISLLSAITAIVVARYSHDITDVLYLLLGQYAVGLIMNIRSGPIKLELKYHFIRLVLGLWSFGGYYLALSMKESSPAKISMILHSAPVLAVLFTASNLISKIGSVFAFGGIVITLAISGSEELSLSFDLSLLLVGTAACSYAASILWLGLMRQKGESIQGINSFYNFSGFLIILILLMGREMRLPTNVTVLLCVSGISALRLQLLTISARSSVVSAKVSVLSNLAFVWLAFYEFFEGSRQPLPYWIGILLVVVGTGSVQLRRSQVRCT